jgi:hypothetical protein
MSTIDMYLQDLLAPQLAAFGAHRQAVEQVTRDVRHRLASLVSRWNDLRFAGRFC